MSYFKPSTLKTIYRAMDDTVFTRHAFTVGDGSSSQRFGNIATWKFSIHFGPTGWQLAVGLPRRRRNPLVAFSASLNHYGGWDHDGHLTSPEGDYILASEPGRATNQEIVELSGIETVVERIIEWIGSLEAEYATREHSEKEKAESGPLDELRNFYAEHIRSHDSVDGEFSTDERVQLESLVNQLHTRIEELYARHEASENQMIRMREQIELLKKSIDILDKRTWLNAAMNRVIDIVKEVRAAKQEVSNLLAPFEHLSLPAPVDHKASIHDDAETPQGPPG